MASFEGVPDETFKLLADLRSEERNRKEWFEAHRDRYERYWVAPARSLVTALGDRLADLSSDLHAVPEVEGGSILRVQRDPRSSKDERPYKDHLDLWLWLGEGPSRGCPGLGVRLTADGIGTGGGQHALEKEALGRMRARLVEDDGAADALARILEDLERQGIAVSGQRARAPKGTPADHPRAGLLRYDGLWAGRDEPRADWIHLPRALPELEARLRPLFPLVAWLHVHAR